VRVSKEDADVETSSEGYARRFAGPIGAWFLDLQARTTLDLLAPWPRGQLAGPLVASGYQVTVLGSDPVCGERVRALTDAGQARFTSGDLLALPCPDRSVDVAMAFRLLPHTSRWRDLIAELARVARRAVVIDYPTRRSVNAVSSLLFGLKKGVEGDTRPFRVFGDAELQGAFAASGYVPSARRPQFFFPMALHRGMGAATVSRFLEGAARASGLTRALGSPVILRLEPRG
jgi:hypothetical protein